MTTPITDMDSPSSQRTYMLPLPRVPHSSRFPEDSPYSSRENNTLLVACTLKYYSRGQGARTNDWVTMPIDGGRDPDMEMFARSSAIDAEETRVVRTIHSENRYSDVVPRPAEPVPSVRSYYDRTAHHTNAPSLRTTRKPASPLAGIKRGSATPYRSSIRLTPLRPRPPPSLRRRGDSEGGDLESNLAPSPPRPPPAPPSDLGPPTDSRGGATMPDLALDPLQQPPPPPPPPSYLLPPADRGAGARSPTEAEPIDSQSPTPRTSSTARTILLCIYSFSQLRAARNHRVIVFRRHLAEGTTSDTQLFLEFRRTYNTELRSFWQRFFSLRGLKYIAVVEYTRPEAPVLLPLDVASRNSIMYAFNRPHKLHTDGAWVDWVFALKSQPPRRYGLEFVQGWDGRKIVVLAAVPWVCSVITAVLWSALTGEVQTGMAVASFMLTASGVVLALLGIVSTLEG